MKRQYPQRGRLNLSCHQYGRTFYVFPLRYVGTRNGLKVYESLKPEYADYLFVWDAAQYKFIQGYDPGKVQRAKIRLA